LHCIKACAVEFSCGPASDNVSCSDLTHSKCKQAVIEKRYVRVSNIYEWVPLNRRQSISIRDLPELVLPSLHASAALRCPSFLPRGFHLKRGSLLIMRMGSLSTPNYQSRSSSVCEFPFVSICSAGCSRTIQDAGSARSDATVLRSKTPSSPELRMSAPVALELRSASPFSC
jgi:hypothetical protein